MHAPCHPALTSLLMLNPPPRESTRENRKKANGLVRTAVRCQAGDDAQDAGDMQCSAHCRRVLWHPPSKNCPNVAPGNFNRGADGALIHSLAIAYRLSRITLPFARQFIPKGGFGPAHLGQMARPAGPFAIYGSWQPGATLVLPELEFQGSADPKSPRGMRDGAQRSP